MIESKAQDSKAAKIDLGKQVVQNHEKRLNFKGNYGPMQFLQGINTRFSSQFLAHYRPTIARRDTQILDYNQQNNNQKYGEILHIHFRRLVGQFGSLIDYKKLSSRPTALISLIEEQKKKYKQFYNNKTGIAEIGNLEQNEAFIQEIENNIQALKLAFDDEEEFYYVVEPEASQQNSNSALNLFYVCKEASKSITDKSANPEPLATHFLGIVDAAQGVVSKIYESFVTTPSLQHPSVTNLAYKTIGGMATDIALLDREENLDITDSKMTTILTSLGLYDDQIQEMIVTPTEPPAPPVLVQKRVVGRCPFGHGKTHFK